MSALTAAYLHKSEVALVGDFQTDAQDITRLLESGLETQLTVHQFSAVEALAATFPSHKWDLLILDHAFWKADPAACKQLRRDLDAPGIVLYNTISVNEVVDLMRDGSCAAVEKLDGERLTAIVVQEFAKKPLLDRGNTISPTLNQMDWFKEILSTTLDAILIYSLEDKEVFSSMRHLSAFSVSPHSVSSKILRFSKVSFTQKIFSKSVKPDRFA